MLGTSNLHISSPTRFRIDATCSLLYVKRRTHLTSALSITPSYLRNDFSDSGLVTDYRDWQIPLGRRFRALKIWFVLRTYGVQGLKAHIRNHIQLGEMFQGLIRSRPDLFKLFTPPAFALTVFTAVPREGAAEPRDAGLSEPGMNEGIVSDKALPRADGVDADRANELTRAVYESVNAAGQIYLTSSVVKGVYTIRVVSANPKADEQHIRRAFDILVQTTEYQQKSMDIARSSSNGIGDY